MELTWQYPDVWVGGAREAAAGAAIGFVTGLLAWRLGRFERGSLLFEPLGAALAAFFALGWASLFPPLSVYVATLAGIIVLIPGFTLTVALSELASRCNVGVAFVPLSDYFRSQPVTKVYEYLLAGMPVVATRNPQVIPILSPANGCCTRTRPKGSRGLCASSGIGASHMTRSGSPTMHGSTRGRRSSIRT